MGKQIGSYESYLSWKNSRTYTSAGCVQNSKVIKNVLTWIPATNGEHQQSKDASLLCWCSSLVAGIQVKTFFITYASLLCWCSSLVAGIQVKTFFITLLF